MPFIATSNAQKCEATKSTWRGVVLYDGDRVTCLQALANERPIDCHFGPVMCMDELQRTSQHDAVETGSVDIYNQLLEM